MPDYAWPPMDKRRVMGKPHKRVDGLDKSTGRAKYSSDQKPPGTLFGALLTSPHAHARITSIDTSEAERLDGVKAVRAIAKAGDEVQWEGAEIAVARGERARIGGGGRAVVARDAHEAEERDTSRRGRDRFRGAADFERMRRSGRH